MNIQIFGFVKIFNDLAQEINETQLNNNQINSINLGDFSSGIYTLVFMLDNNIPIIKKIIITE